MWLDTLCRVIYFLSNINIYNEIHILQPQRRGEEQKQYKFIEEKYY